MGGSNEDLKPWMMVVFALDIFVIVYVLGVFSTFQCYSCSSESVANQSTNNEELTQSLPTIHRFGSSVFFFVERNVYPDGCGNNQRFGGDTPSSDGLLGLANTNLSIVSQLCGQGLIRNVIGHCIGRRGTGFFFLGDDLVSHFEIVWMPMLPNSFACYSPGWAQLLFNGKTTGHKDIYTFDSGSTYSYFNSKTYQATLSWLKKNLIGKPLKAVADVPHLPVCWKGPKPFNSTEEVKNYFKPLGLSFSSRNVQLQLPPEAYLIISNHGNVCLGILDGGSQILTRPFNVIGEISLQDKLVVYDNENKRIGWAPSSCNMPF
ncbi:hypothetical protein F0562_002838 [Nyssa sinensis]|uniref:Peptidase A1 domain-containing protein n=1 Tax=Nyssa sinensis TaxID=561372 RepID=A0A5J5BTL4_9ASTE|nr:hypothetical protein F0562_002838 [Nyssa sinensis]